MARVAANDIRLNVQQVTQRGESARPDLLLVHGLASNMGFWLGGYVDALAPYFRITLFDMRGHGRSDCTSTGYRPDQLADDLAALSAELGLKRPHVMAHSFGGVAALNWAQRAPDAMSSLVILDSQIGLGRAKGAVSGDPTLAPALKAGGIDVDLGHPFAGIHILTEVSRRKISGGRRPSDDARVRYLLDSISEGAARKWLRLVDGTAAMAELTAEDGITAGGLEQIATPLLAMYGSQSPSLASGRILADHAGDAQLQIIPMAGHFFAGTRTAEVLKRCTAFWSGLSVKTGGVAVPSTDATANAEAMAN